MICSKCGKECADGMKFCTECGAELVAEAQATVEETVENAVETVAEEAKEAAAEAVETVAEEVKEVSEEVAAEAEEVKEEAAEVAEAVAEEVKEAKEEVAAEAEEIKEAVKETAKEEKKKAEKTFDALQLPEGKNGKKAIAIGAALVVVLLGLVILISSLGSKDESYMKVSEKAVLSITERDGDLYAIYFDGKEVKLEDEDADSQEYSMDGSVVCYENEEDELVILKEGKVIKTGIDDAEGVMISQKGNTMVYFTDCEMATYNNTDYGFTDSIKVGTLNLYDIKKKSSIEIEEEVVVNSAVLSPDGKTVAYVAEYEATDDFKGFYSVNGKEPVELGKEKRIFAIADKAKYIYYSDVDRIYVMKKNKEEKLASDVRNVEALMNADNTEMLFFNEDKTYITVKAGEKKKVAGEELSKVILSDDAAVFEQDLNKEKGGISVMYTGVDTFKEKLFFCRMTDEIYYMLNKYETEKLASSAYQYAVADDGESLVYNNFSDIILVTKFSKGGEKETLANGAMARYMYADGSLDHIYIKNYDDELYYIKKGKGKKIADDVTEAMISPDGEYCYYVVDDEDFCYSKKGGKEKELVSVDDGSISCMREGGKAMVAVKEDDTKTLYKMEGKKMKTIYVQEDMKAEDYIEDALENLEDYLN